MRVYALISTFLMLGLYSVSATAGALPERVCKPEVSGSASAFLKISAKRDTVNDWKAKVRELYGADWANYTTARVEVFPCNRSGLITQACKVRAQPCMEVESNNS